MKKIIHITSLHPRNDIRIFQKELLSLKEAGFDAGAIVADGNGDDITLFPIYDVGNEPNRLKRFIKINRKIFKKALELDADLYHFHDPELFWIGYKLKRKGKKVIYDIHEDVPAAIMSKPYIRTSIRKSVSIVVKAIENFFAKKYTGCITATPFIRDRFLTINPNTIDINNYPKLNELSPIEGQTKQREQAVCYVGIMTEIRGLEQILDAMELVDAKLYLAGMFYDEDFKIKLQSKPAWSKVVWCGFLNRKEMAEMISKVRAGFVLFHPEPNHINAQPNKLFEYMSAKLPVICSDFPLWNELIYKNNCGYTVNPFDTKEIVKALNLVLSNDELIYNLGNNGYQAVYDKYNWEAEKSKLIDFYNNILAS